MGGRSYADLIAWQKAIELVVDVYRVTGAFPTEEERFGLTAQLRKAAVSVPAKIAEGQGRFGEREFVNFLSIAHGSLREVETHLHLAYRLGYLPAEPQQRMMEQCSEIGRLINGLANSLRNPSS